VAARKAKAAKRYSIIPPRLRLCRASWKRFRSCKTAHCARAARRPRFRTDTVPSPRTRRVAQERGFATAVAGFAYTILQKMHELVQDDRARGYIVEPAVVIDQQAFLTIDVGPAVGRLPAGQM
jgi:hypothetical protein